MITHELLASFALTCLAIELTPGPNMSYLALLSAMKGRKAGFAAMIGTIMGLLALGLIAALGAAALIGESRIFYDVLRWVGVAYLLWLAYDCWRSELSSAPHDSIYHPRLFLRGFLVNLLNPKAALFYIAVLPSFTNPDEALLPQTIALTLLSVAIAALAHGIIVILGARAQPYLQNAHIARYTRYFFTALLVGIAIWFALSTR
jgi:threonine/homoserine/homoserine lactone efflux protein